MKNSIAYSAESNRGYIDNSKVNPKGVERETFETGSPNAGAKDRPMNKWLPENEFPGFKDFFSSWWEDCSSLSQSLLLYLGEALHLKNTAILAESQCNEDCHIGFLHYPPAPLASLRTLDTKRLKAHTDFSRITMIFQDSIGGLEVSDGQVFRPVLPRPATIVMNIGDFLERQTNGRWKSSLHRVVAPMTGGGEMTPDRHSIAFFVNPDKDSKVEILPDCEDKGKWHPGESSWKEGLSVGEWFQKKFKSPVVPYGV